MKIGWLSFDNSLNDLLNNLVFAKHKVFYLENKENDLTLKENENFYRVDSIQKLILESDVLFTYFKKIEDLYRFYTYPNGIFDLAKKNNKKIICVDLSLSSANLVKKILSKNPMVYFLEAPIIFSEDSNKKITRIMPVSGRKYVYDKVDLLLADLGIEHYYAGGFGSAQVISSANNILKSTVALGVFEAISYAMGNNLDLNLLFDAVKNGAGGSNLLADFYKFYKKDKFTSLNNNFIGAANQIEIVLSDNKKNKEEFLLTKIVNGILKKEENKSISIDLDLFAKFYNLNLSNTVFTESKNSIFSNSNLDEYEKNINYKFENEINNNKFEANFLVGDERDFFDQTIQKGGSKNKLDAFVDKISENKPLIEKDNLTEINNLNNFFDFDESSTDFYSENFFNVSDEKNNQSKNIHNVSSQEKQKIYESPESLKETKLGENLKDYFVDKVDEEYGSLLPKDKNFVESALQLKNDLKKDSKKDVVEKFFLEQTQNSPSGINHKEEKDEIFSFGIEEEDRSFDPFLENDKNKLIKSKILIFDLDGTLLNSNHKVNQENIKALHSASEKGNKVIIATGRCYDQITETVNSLGKIVDYAIINNGALLYDNSKNFLIQNANPLTADIRSVFVKTAYDNKISFLAYSELDSYAYVFPNDLEKFSIYTNENTIDLSNLSKQDLEAYLNNPEINIYNFSAYQENMSEKDWIEMFKSFKNENKCNITSALKGYIDIYSPTSKYFGYLKLKEIINCDDNDVYFFGDSNNDYDLLSYLPNSIAMGNASKTVKDAAKYVIDNNDSNAISEFLKNNNLI